MRRIITVAVPLVLAGVLLSPIGAGARQAEERSRTQGLKETDRFVKAGGKTSEAVANAKLQIQKTLDTYNALVTQPSKDMKGDYKKLMKSVDGMNDRVTEGRQKLDEMQQAGDTYFGGRAEGIKAISDPQLQDRAKQRMTDSQKEFARVLQSLREAGQALEPFRKELADQITYLGSDLTPSAMTSLKPNADKLNAHGKEVFAKTDKAIADANAYFKSLRATES
jgi:predicted  nucleic acid-binding Zn-ribbon protein